MIKTIQKGQSSLEYAVFLIIVMAAILLGGIYFKRGIQGRWKQSVDELGDQYDPRIAVGDVYYRLESYTDTTITTDETLNREMYTYRYDTSTQIDTKEGSLTLPSY